MDEREMTQVLFSDSYSQGGPNEKLPVGTLEVDGVFHTVFNTQNTIGRDESCDIVIGHVGVSSRHAVIDAEDPNGHIIFDVGSTNKTRLGKVPLRPHVRYFLNDGDRLLFGAVSAHYNKSKQPLDTPEKVPPTDVVPESPPKDEVVSNIVIESSPEKEDCLDKSDVDLFDEKDGGTFQSPFLGKPEKQALLSAERDIFKEDAYLKNIENRKEPSTTSLFSFRSPSAPKDEINGVSHLVLRESSANIPKDTNGIEDELDAEIPIIEELKDQVAKTGWDEFTSSTLKVSTPVKPLCSDDNDNSVVQLSSQTDKLKSEAMSADEILSQNMDMFETSVAEEEKLKQYEQFSPSLDESMCSISTQDCKDINSPMKENKVQDILEPGSQPFDETLKKGIVDESPLGRVDETAVSVLSCSDSEITLRRSLSFTTPNDSTLPESKAIAHVESTIKTTECMEAEKSDKNTEEVSPEEQLATDSRENESEIFTQGFFDAGTQQLEDQTHQSKLDDTLTFKIPEKINASRTTRELANDGATPGFYEADTQKLESKTAEEKLQLIQGSDEENKVSEALHETCMSEGFYEAETQPNTYDQSKLVSNISKENPGAERTGELNKQEIPKETLNDANDTTITGDESSVFHHDFYEAETQPQPEISMKDGASVTHDAEGERKQSHDPLDNSVLLTQGFYEAETQVFNAETAGVFSKNDLEPDILPPVEHLSTKLEPEETVKKPNTEAELKKLNDSSFYELTQGFYEAETQQYSTEGNPSQELSISKSSDDTCFSSNNKESHLEQKDKGSEEITCMNESLPDSCLFDAETQKLENPVTNQKDDLKEMEPIDNVIEKQSVTPGTIEIQSPIEKSHKSSCMLEDIPEQTEFSKPHLKIEVDSNPDQITGNTNIYELDTEPFIHDASISNESDKNNAIPLKAEELIIKTDKNIYEAETISSVSELPEKDSSTISGNNELTVCGESNMELSKSLIEKDSSESSKKEIEPVLSGDTVTGIEDMSLSCINFPENHSQSQGDENSKSDDLLKTKRIGNRKNTLELLNDLMDDKSEVEEKNEINDYKIKDSNEANLIVEAVETNIIPSAITSEGDEKTSNVESKKMKRVVQCKGISDALPDNSFTEDSFSQLRSTKRNKKFVISNNSEDDSSQEFNFKFKRNKSNVFPPDTQEPLTEENNSVEASVLSNLEMTSPNTLESSEDMNIIFNRNKNCVFPPDTEELETTADFTANADETTTEQQLADEETVKQESADKETVKQESAVEETAEQKPAVEETAEQKPAIEETAEQKSAVEETAEQKPAIEETAEQKPAVEETAEQKPAVEETAEQKPALEETSEQKPAVEETAEQKPALEETAEKKSPVEETAEQKSAEGRLKSDKVTGDATTKIENAVAFAAGDNKSEPQMKEEVKSEKIGEGNNLLESPLKSSPKRVKGSPKTAAEQSFISRGNITLHSQEVLEELEEEFRLAAVTMSPAKLSVASDSEEESQPLTPEGPKVRRSERKLNSNIVYKPKSLVTEDSEPSEETMKEDKKCEGRPKMQEVRTSPSVEPKLNNETPKAPAQSDKLSVPTIRSVKKFKKASPPKAKSNIEESDTSNPLEENPVVNKKRNSVELQDSQDSSIEYSESEELGRGKRKKIKKSFEGFLGEEVFLKYRKRLSHSPPSGPTGNGIKEKKIEDRSPVLDPSRCNKLNPVVRLEKLLPGPSFNSGARLSELNDDDLILPKKKTTCIEPAKPSTSNKNEEKKVNQTVNKTQSFSFCEKLDELFDDIWSPADTVKLSPRLSKKSGKLPTKKEPDAQKRSTRSVDNLQDETSKVSSQQGLNSRKRKNDNTSAESHSTEVTNIPESGSSHELIKRTSSNSLSAKGKEKHNKEEPPRRRSSSIEDRTLRKDNKKLPKVSVNETTEVTTRSRLRGSGNEQNISDKRRVTRLNKNITEDDKVEEQIQEIPSKLRSKRKISSPERNSDKSKMNDCTSISHKNKPTGKILPKVASESIDRDTVSASDALSESNSVVETRRSLKVKAEAPKPKDTRSENLTERSTKKSSTSKKSQIPLKKRRSTKSTEESDDMCLMSQEFSFHEPASSEKQNELSEEFRPPQLAVRRSTRSKKTERKKKERDPEKVMFTGLNDKKLLTYATDLGGEVVESPFTCTVLVTDKVRRTTKFLSALSRGLPIVTPEWLCQSFKTGEFLDFENFLVTDKDAENQYSFCLEESLKKAQSSKVLDGRSIFVTPSVKPSLEDIKSIVECSGGKLLTKQPARWPPNSLVISCKEDEDKWAGLKKRGKMPLILDIEALFSGILKQSLDLTTHHLA